MLIIRLIFWTFIEKAVVTKGTKEGWNCKIAHHKLSENIFTMKSFEIQKYLKQQIKTLFSFLKNDEKWHPATVKYKISCNLSTCNFYSIGTYRSCPILSWGGGFSQAADQSFSHRLTWLSHYHRQVMGQRLSLSLTALFSEGVCIPAGYFACTVAKKQQN